MTVKEMETGDLVAEAVRLDIQQKDGKRKLDAVKAEIQSRGLQTIEDRNVKFIRYHSPAGSVSVTDTQSMDVYNVDRLRELLSEGVWKSKVVEETRTKYTYDKKLEKMLKAVFTGDYTFEYTLEEFLDQMSEVPDAKQKKLLLRKLKGEYAADRRELMAVFGHSEGDVADNWFDVELWHIYRIKNGELIRAFLPEEFLDDTIIGIRKCLTVDTKTSITIDYEKERG